VSAREIIENGEALAKEATENGEVSAREIIENGEALAKEATENGEALAKEATENGEVSAREIIENGEALAKEATENGEVSAREIIENGEALAREIIESLEAMSAVRDTDVANSDSEIVGNDGSRSRIRTYDPKKSDEYKKSRETKKRYEIINSKDELSEKTCFAKEEREKLSKEIQQKKRIKQIKKTYALSGKVIQSAKEITSPLVVFMQYPFQGEAACAGISKKMLRATAYKYNAKIENIRIVLFEDKKDLSEKSKQDSAANRMLNTFDGRGVVFCNEHSGIHPGQEKSENIFENFLTNEGEPKVYYIKERIEALQQGEDIYSWLIGPHIALAVGIKELKAGNYSSALLGSINGLIADMSGGEIVMKTDEDVINFINRLLTSEEMFRIKRIDFESMREQIKAEEEAMVAL
ncbi:MAG: hypothetical protein ABH844_02370, partial [Candidatus Omnitrophota bacterium]